MTYAESSIAASYAEGSTSFLSYAHAHSAPTMKLRRRSEPKQVFENSVAKPAFAGTPGATIQGNQDSSALTTLGLSHRAVSSAFAELQRVVDRPTSEAALKFLFQVASAVQEIGLDDSCRPLVVGLEDGGATTLEWILPNSRLAFAFEEDGTESFSVWTAAGEQDFGVLDTQTRVAELLRIASR